ncbi:RNA-directed DNA polymerase, eukaryota, reverse transcriptase zinc-binding domain protein [Tanacetum coccineum]
MHKHDSWGWKSILDLRELVGKHMRYKIGNGKNVNVWHDRWNNDESPSKYISKKEIFYAGFSDNNNVADLIDTNGWQWPAKWKEKYRFLNNIPIPQLTSNPDTSVWISNDGKEGKFSTNRMWKDVRRMNNKVEWNDIVWHSNCIPRHNFVLWMAIQNKICTQDKLAKWYPNNTYCCSLCKKEGDTHDHLFLNCDYAMELWEKVKDKAKMCGFATNWKDIVIEISKWKSKRSVWGTIRKLCFAAAVYYLWQERNRRTFSNVERSSAELLKILEEEVRNRMLSITVKQSYAVQQAEEQWKVKVNWKMAKRSYRDGWAIVIVDDASYRRLHWCFVRKGAAKITSVLSEVVAAFDLIAYLHEGNVAYIECFSSVRPVWCCDYRSSTLDDLYDAILDKNIHPIFPPPPPNGQFSDKAPNLFTISQTSLVDLTKPGASIIIQNGKIDMFKGSMRLAVDPVAFQVNEDNNLSFVEYELVNIARELRLRDIGGIIVVDFIDIVDDERIRLYTRGTVLGYKRTPWPLWLTAWTGKIIAGAFEGLEKAQTWSLYKNAKEGAGSAYQKAKTVKEGAGLSCGTRLRRCRLLLRGNADALRTELLDSLLKMAPTKEKERKLKEHIDDTSIKLGHAEKFLKADLNREQHLQKNVKPRAVKRRAITHSLRTNVVESTTAGQVSSIGSAVENLKFIVPTSQLAADILLWVLKNEENHLHRKKLACDAVRGLLVTLLPALQPSHLHLRCTPTAVMHHRRSPAFRFHDSGTGFRIKSRRIKGDEDTVAFMRMCLQPWQIGYILIPARTRNSEPNSKPAFYMFCEVGGSGRDKDTVVFITCILAKQHETLESAHARSVSLFKSEGVSVMHEDGDHWKFNSGNMMKRFSTPHSRSLPMPLRGVSQQIDLKGDSVTTGVDGRMNVRSMKMLRGLEEIYFLELDEISDFLHVYVAWYKEQRAHARRTSTGVNVRRRNVVDRTHSNRVSIATASVSSVGDLENKDQIDDEQSLIVELYETGFSTFQRQLGEVSDSKVSSISDTNSNSSDNDLEHKDHIKDEHSLEAEMVEEVLKEYDDVYTLRVRMAISSAISSDLNQK